VSPATVPDWISAVVAGQPERPAVLNGSERWSYSGLWERSRRVAAGLLERREFSPGRKVGVVGLNSPDYLAAYFGVMRAGGVIVPLNATLSPAELRTQLQFVEAAGCLLGEDDSDLEEALSPDPVWRIAELDGASGSTLPAVGADSEATVLLTSGTTGAPKGVVHTHQTLLHAALQMALALPLASDDVNLAFLPFFASIPEQILPTLLVGGALYVLRRFDPEEVSEACGEATTFDSVPTIVSRLLEHGDYSQLNRLRWIAFASEPMPPAVLERWWERVPDVRTYEFYGMTEMLTITHAGPDDLRLDPGTAGVAYATSRVGIVDGDLNPLPDGEEGEVICLSPARMRGYLADEAATAAALTADGAVRTGDLGKLDEAGRLRLTGRVKDLIISGGMNIAPAEIEAVACRHPDVADAAAVGIPDDRWGETPIIVAVPAHGNSLNPVDLLEHCRGVLAGYKRPSGAAVVDRLPVTGIGKSAKGELRQAIMKGEVQVVRAT
jgi:fatty-acyl-CoA synthase